MTCQDEAVEDDTDQSLRQQLIERLWLLGEIESTQTALFHQAAAARYGLGVTDMKALSILLRDGAQSAGSLREQLAVTSGAVTGVIDRLERHGLANRQADPRDRRRVIIEVDEVGLAARENIYLGIGAAFEELYAGYSTEELRFLARHLEAAIEITREQLTALR